MHLQLTGFFKILLGMCLVVARFLVCVVGGVGCWRYVMSNVSVVNGECGLV